MAPLKRIVSRASPQRPWLRPTRGGGLGVGTPPHAAQWHTQPHICSMSFQRCFRLEEPAGLSFRPSAAMWVREFLLTLLTQHASDARAGLCSAP